MLETLNDYMSLMATLDERRQIAVRRTVGLKMEELRAQLEMLKDLAK